MDRPLVLIMRERTRKYFEFIEVLTQIDLYIYIMINPLLELGTGADLSNLSMWWPLGGIYCGGPLYINKEIYFFT